MHEEVRSSPGPRRNAFSRRRVRADDAERLQQYSRRHECERRAGPVSFQCRRFTIHTPDGQQVTGTYAIEGDQICLTPTGGERACTQYVGDKNVGDTWTQTGTDGSQVTVTLQAGR
jgi:hypothetical protein